MNRREMLKATGMAIAGTTLLGANAFANESNNNDIAKRKKALIIGAHPDDPETGCGGTMILLRQAGYEVVSVYMTKGQGGIVGKSHDEAAEIRTREGINACKILDARPIFMSQIDGNCEINKSRYVEMRELIAAEQPDIVFTHWPIDSHPDHRVCSLLVYDAWRRLDYCFNLYYFEVMSGTQTQLFQPTDYVDITAVATQNARHVTVMRAKTSCRYMKNGTKQWNVSEVLNFAANMPKPSSTCAATTATSSIDNQQALSH